MIKFSLSRILEESPYNLILSGTDFRFITDFGIHYSVSFNKEDIVLGECETYQLIIRKIDEIRSKHDPKVEKQFLPLLMNSSGLTWKFCFICVTQVMDVKVLEIDCSFLGLKNMLIKSDSQYVRHLQVLRGKAYLSELLLRIGIPRFTTLSQILMNKQNYCQPVTNLNDQEKNITKRCSAKNDTI